MKKRITKTLLFLFLLLSVLLSACGRKKESGQISEERINESVRRIIRAKLTHGLTP